MSISDAHATASRGYRTTHQTHYTKERRTHMTKRKRSHCICLRLTDDEYLYYSKGKSVTLTPEGEKRAIELIAKYLK